MLFLVAHSNCTPSPETFQALAVVYNLLVSALVNKLALHRFKNRLRCSSPGSTLVKRIEINRRRVLNPRPTDMRNIYHLITEFKLSESGRPQSRSSEVWNE